jgi:Bacteriophage Lambda NinG protein
MRLALKTLSQLKAELQAVVNAYVRERDRDLPCISCGATAAKQWHAGHFLTTGAHPGLIRFHPWNINRQCSQCNDYLSGNLLNYRKGIIARFGQERLDWLEGPQKDMKITREWIEAEKIRFRALLRDLQKEAND